MTIVCVAYISTGQIMGWGHKAIEIRAVETGHLDGVFMHKKAQKLKFLCERNDKVHCDHSDKLHEYIWATKTLCIMCSMSKQLFEQVLQQITAK